MLDSPLVVFHRQSIDDAIDCGNHVSRLRFTSSGAISARGFLGDPVGEGTMPVGPGFGSAGAGGVVVSESLGMAKDFEIIEARVSGVSLIGFRWLPIGRKPGASFWFVMVGLSAEFVGDRGVDFGARGRRPGRGGGVIFF